MVVVASVSARLCRSWLLVGPLLAGCAAHTPAPVIDRSPRADVEPEAAPAVIAATAPRTVEVVRGDTLYGIAFRHGLDWRDLARWNGLREPYTIFPGQVLRLSPPAVSELKVATARPVPDEERPAQREALAPVPVAEEGAQQAPLHPSPMPTSPKLPTTLAGSSSATTTPSARAESPPQPPASAPSPRAPAPPATAATSPQPVLPTPASEDRAAGPFREVDGIRWTWPAEGPILQRFVPGDPLRQGIDIGGRAGDVVRAAADGVVVYSGAGLVGYGELVIIKHDDRYLSAYGHNRRRLVVEGERVRAGQPIAEMGRTGTDRDKLHFEIRRDGKPVDPLRYLAPR